MILSESTYGKKIEMKKPIQMINTKKLLGKVIKELVMGTEEFNEQTNMMSNTSI